MKKKNFIKLLRKFAKDESKEVLKFITKFENAHSIINRPNKKKLGKYKIPKKFTKETYQEYLETPLWKTIRRRVFKIKGKECEGCGSKIRLQIHHSVYSQRVFTGSSLNGLRVVCSHCHEEIHKAKKNGTSLRQATVLILDKRPVKKITVSKLSKELEDLKKMKKSF